MGKLSWNVCVGMTALLFIMSNAQPTSAQQPGLEQAREPVNKTGKLGARSKAAKPISAEEENRPGFARPPQCKYQMSKKEARRLKAVRRDPARRVTTEQRPPGLNSVRPRAEFREGLELAREPVSTRSTFRGKADTEQVKSEEEDSKPGTLAPTDYNRSISREEALRLKEVRRDPARRVTKKRRP